MKSILLMSVIFLAFTSNADQCAWNTKTDGKSALEFLKPNDEILLWCQKCDEAKSSVIQVVDAANFDRDTNEISIKTHEKSSGKIINNGQVFGVDLAYTYVRTATDIFSNLAQLVGCPSTGASTFIQNKGGQKIPHHYDSGGVRVDGVPQMTELAGVDLEKAFKKGKFRSPASNK